MAVLKAMTSGGKRRESDFYPTPSLATRALLPLIGGWPVNRVWEPACGDGAIGRILEAEGFTVIASDLHDRGYGQSGLDFLSTGCAKGEALITNPPFNLADKFIAHAHRIGVKRMALLLKIDFWNAANRMQQFREFPPAAVYPLMWRLDFTGAGRPHTNCMWATWEPGDAPTKFEPILRPMLKTESAEDLLA